MRHGDLDRVNGGMKRSSSENATNATRDPETMFTQGPVGPTGPGGPGASGTEGPKPWKQRFSFRQPRKQPTLEEVSGGDERVGEISFFRTLNE